MKAKITVKCVCCGYTKEVQLPDSYPDEAISEKSSLIDERKIWMKGYNQACTDHRLALVKKLEG